MKVSVCMPIYNGERFLPAAIESVLNQTLTDFELLVLDDGSTDSSIEIVRNYARQDRRIIVWQNKKREGLFGNYNACMRIAVGKYIKPFSQDDLLKPRSLEVLSSVLDHFPQVVLATSSREIIDEQGSLLKNPTDGFVDIKYGEPWAANEVVRKSLFPVVNFIGEPACVMFRSESVGSGFDQRFNHLGDLEYWLRLLRGGHLFAIEETLAAFRMHSQNQTSFNMMSLRFAPDMVRLANSLATEIESTGCSLDEYLDRCTVWIAEHISYLFENGEATSETIGTANISPHDLSQLHSLTVRCLKQIGDISRSLPQTSCDADDPGFTTGNTSPLANRARGRLLSGLQSPQAMTDKIIRRRELRLRRLLSSYSWRVTRPLRETKRLLGSYSLVAAPGFEPEAVFSGGTHNAYLRFLRKEIIKLLSSRSWRMTVPLRIASLRGESTLY